jgi:hypothetical protein
MQVFFAIFPLQDNDLASFDKKKTKPLKNNGIANLMNVKYEEILTFSGH